MPPTSDPRLRPVEGHQPAGFLPGFRALAVRRPILLVWFGTVMFSAGPVMASTASISGPAFSFWRLWIGTALVGTLALVNRYRRHVVPRIVTTSTGLRWTIVAGVCFAFHQLMLMTALRATSVVDVTLMNTLSPVVVAVLAVPLFDERPGVSFRVWSAVAIVGAAIVAVAGSTGEHGQPVGVALAAGNVVFYALFFVASKHARDDIDTMAFLAGSLVVAAVVVSAFVVLSGTEVGTVSSHDLLLCLGVALLPGLAGHFSVTWSLKWVPANLPPVIMLSIPVLSGLQAWVLLDQGVSALKLAGGLVTLFGVACAVRSPGARALAVEALDLAEEA